MSIKTLLHFVSSITSVKNRASSAKLFKKELIEDFKFSTDYHLAEDALFLTEVILETKCNSVFIDKPIYYYDHREGSATTSVNNHVFQSIAF